MIVRASIAPSMRGEVETAHRRCMGKRIYRPAHTRSTYQAPATPSAPSWGAESAEVMWVTAVGVFGFADVILLVSAFLRG